MKIGIIGLGLIGGSLAMSIRNHTEHTVFGFDIDPRVMLRARAAEAIHDELTTDMLPGCDIVLVSLFPQLCADWMAGREFSGFAAARANLFENASMILCPPPEAPLEAREAAKAFFLESGFKSVRFCTPQAHDQMIAYTSQLAHIVSGAYVKNPLSRDHKGFSAGSFLDMTRVARMNEVMWTELFLENDDLLLPALDDLIARLNEYREALSSKDPEKVLPVLREGRIAKEALD